MYGHLAQKLKSQAPVILDGGTGTEIQRRGVPMDDGAWCAMANLSHADVVREVHQDYIRVGAEVITANTYASSPLSFLPRGREQEIEAIDRMAVQLARQAIDAVAVKPVALAGSISVMPAIEVGTDRAAGRHWPEARIRSLYREKAEGLAEAGCDLLIMEMMRDLDVSLWATEAAVETGLPVWVGISVELGEDGALVAHGNRKWELQDMVRGLTAPGARAALVMHSEMSVTDQALPIIRSEFRGPVGAYPEVGFFEMPNWVFKDMSPTEFARACRRWRDDGATILGGCCGITPAHIEALSSELGSGNA